jgi:hypothetical protein
VEAPLKDGDDDMNQGDNMSGAPNQDVVTLLHYQAQPTGVQNFQQNTFRFREPPLVGSTAPQLPHSVDSTENLSFFRILLTQLQQSTEMRKAHSQIWVAR